MKGKIKYILFFLAIASFFSACKKEETEPTFSSDSVRVSAFAFTADTAVLENLNTVFFTIDLENGLIFNADSLPKGTNVTALAVTVTTDMASSVIITQGDGKVINYLESTTAKIDFSSPAVMEVVSQSGNYSKKYRIEVNVHTVKADLLSWGGMQYSSLPGVGTLSDQKTVKYKNMIYTYMLRSGQYRLAVAALPGDDWSETELNLPFVPDLRSLQSSPEALYLLDTDGNLYSSEDGISWSAAGEQYAALLGWHNGGLLTLSLVDGIYYHDQYPRPVGFVPQRIADDFPVSGLSDMLIYNSSWMTAPQAMIVGGRTSQGDLTGAMWGYDGTTWAKLNNALPEREGALFFQYVTFLVDKNWVTTENVAWFVIGGLNDQTSLRDVWVSTNYGIIWEKAVDSMQLPGYIVSRGYASVVICEEPINATVNWTALDAPSVPDGYRLLPLRGIESENLVPYIYMFGGLSKDNFAYDQIWRGIINRLRFEPIP